MTHTIDIGGVIAKITDQGVLINPKSYVFGLQQEWYGHKICELSIGYKKFNLNRYQRKRVFSLDDVEIITIAMALHEAGYKKQPAARLLGIANSTLRDKLKKYKITHPSWKNG